MRLLGAALVAIALSSGAAHAQAYQCRPPSAPVSVPRIEQDGPTRRMPVSGYTLALSWSPEFCRDRQDNPRNGAPPASSPIPPRCAKVCA